MVNANNAQAECSFTAWYPQFLKESLEAISLPISNEIFKYLEHDAFVLPVEATKNIECNSEWSDGSSVNPVSSEVSY